MSKEFFEQELIKHDKNLVRRLGQYKEPMIYYNYAMILKLEKLLGRKSNLPGVKLFREFCRKISKSELYKDYDNFLKKLKESEETG